MIDEDKTQNKHDSKEKPFILMSTSYKKVWLDAHSSKPITKTEGTMGVKRLFCAGLCKNSASKSKVLLEKTVERFPLVASPLHK